MTTATTATNGIEPERVRLLADRLCWLAEGQDGMRRRHGLWRANKTYRDKYDREAEALASTLLKPKEIPAIEPVGWKQLTLI